MVKDAGKEQLQEEMKLQTDAVIYNKKLKVIEPFSPQTLYEEEDPDSCIFTDVAVSLNDPDNYGWTEREMFKILLELPYIVKDLQIFLQRSNQYKVL